jgi:uncharacterized protein YdhG (YjbR/CyaY superfamily)
VREATLDAEERISYGVPTLRFPLTDPLPYDLVARIVAARLQHTLQRP